MSTCFKLNDKVKLKGYKNEGRIVEIIDSDYCMVEFNDIKVMKDLVCTTLYFEYLEDVKSGKISATHVAKKRIDELEKIIEE